MFYRALGLVVWKLALKYLRERYGRVRKPAAALTVVAAIAAIYVATRGGDE
ncbi:MAG TPA: hypothetical protein VFB51_15470 [Solirubrobacterales bacterium]|nr:hypothetical protein [Solirubrobacterales bacterium]